MERYVRRVRWLLTGSRRLFGSVVHERAIFLLDTSGSMVEHMVELKRELKHLIWDQLHKHQIRFDFVRFSDEAGAWLPAPIAPTEDACHKAVEWIEALDAFGNTNTLEALRSAFALAAAGEAGGAGDEVSAIVNSVRELAGGVAGAVVGYRGKKLRLPVESQDIDTGKLQRGVGIYLLTDGNESFNSFGSLIKDGNVAFN